jgi:hypothetical protein
VCWAQCRRLGGDHLPPLRGQLGAATGAFDDDLVRGVGEAVECGVAEDRVSSKSPSHSSTPRLLVKAKLLRR